MCGASATNCKRWIPDLPVNDCIHTSYVPITDVDSVAWLHPTHYPIRSPVVYLRYAASVLRTLGEGNDSIEL